MADSEMPSEQKGRADKRLLIDWVSFVAVNLGAFVTAVWKYRNGDCTPRVALVSGILASVGLTAVLLPTIRVRDRRMGRSTPRPLTIGAAVISALTAGGLWWMLGNEMSVRDIMMTASSSKPINEIRPEEKALIVQFFRKEIERDRAIKQIVIQRKPPNPPLFSNASFHDRPTMQQELAWLNEAVMLESSTYDQHERNLEDFRSVMSKRYPDYIKSFNLGARSKEELSAEIISLDRQLLEAAIDLYGFAARNPENIIYSNGILISHDPAVWHAFDEKRKKCISIYQRLRSLVPKWLPG